MGKKEKTIGASRRLAQAEQLEKWRQLGGDAADVRRWEDWGRRGM